MNKDKEEEYKEYIRELCIDLRKTKQELLECKKRCEKNNKK